MVTDSKDSMLAAISSVIVPVFKPLGLGDWRISVSYTHLMELAKAADRTIMLEDGKIR